MENLQIIEFFHENEKLKFENKEPKKRCSKCGIRKPYSQFYKHPNTRDELHPYCKECNNKKQKEFIEKYKEINENRDPYNPKETKECSNCNKELPKTKRYWGKRKNAKDGLDYYCKECKNKKQKELIEKNKEINKNRDPYNPKETKECSKCNRELPKTKRYWHKSNSRRDGLHNYCKKCKAIIQRKIIYNLTYDQQKELFSSQDSKCAICGRELLFLKGHLDHDHKTGEVRGFLCGKCNVLLGKARDNPLILFKAITYLKQSKKEENKI
jgi:hypothetical protein